MKELEEALFELIARAKSTYDFRTSTGFVWKVLSAIRGPDEIPYGDEEINFEALKLLTTARVRALFLDAKEEDTYSRGLGFVRAKPLSEEEIALRDRLLQKFSMHFRMHFYDAMDVLRHLGYDVPKIEIEWR